MTTQDHYAPGNYGLMDTIKVLKFIKNYGRIFGGDPNKVTLVGHGSGAAMVGLLLVSPKAKDVGELFYHLVSLLFMGHFFR